MSFISFVSDRLFGPPIFRREAPTDHWGLKLFVEVRDVPSKERKAYLTVESVGSVQLYRFEARQLSLLIESLEEAVAAMTGDDGSRGTERSRCYPLLRVNLLGMGRFAWTLAMLGFLNSIANRLFGTTVFRRTMRTDQWGIKLVVKVKQTASGERKGYLLFGRFPSIRGYRLKAQDLSTLVERLKDAAAIVKDDRNA